MMAEAALEVQMVSVFQCIVLNYTFLKFYNAFIILSAKWSHVLLNI